MSPFFTLICAAVLSLGGLHAAAQTDAGGSRAAVHVIASQNLHCDDTVLVYSPKGSEAVRGLPTLILLHGYSGSPRDWDANMDVQGLCDEYGFRLICPDGFKDSWYINKLDSTDMRWRDFFWFELWPLMDERYGLLSDRTFVDGLSMGGHGAVNLFLDRPELMRGAGSMSGVLNLRNAGGSCELIPPMLGVTDISDPVCDAQSAVNRISRVREHCGSDAESKVFVVSCGSVDKTFLPATREFEAKANADGLRVVAVYSPARHRWPYWVWALRLHLDCFRQTVDGGVFGYTDK